jgi:uncharacterized protein YecE (DUF72 family)
LRKARLFLGTSGYSYKDWKGAFYPEDLKEKAWLEHYAGFFDTVELNVTFYRLPEEEAFLSWHERTPGNFTFSVKGSRFITHIKRLKDPAQSLKLFFSRIKLLKKKLGPVLWQLPPSFKADSKRLEGFLKGLKQYRGIRQVFEFRNKTWYSKEILDMLKAEGMVLCSADWPAFSKGIKSAGDFIYLRRHGRGAKLYGGRYANRQLKKDAGIIKENLEEKRDVYIYFNNDAHGYAVKNALTLKKMRPDHLPNRGGS